MPDNFLVTQRFGFLGDHLKNLKEKKDVEEDEDEDEYPTKSPPPVYSHHIDALARLVPEIDAWLSTSDRRPKIENVVAKTSFMCPIDLCGLNGKINCSDYKPKKFAATMIRIGPPRCTALLFPNGNVVMTGVDSIETARACIQNLRLLLESVGIRTKLSCIKISNIVYTALVKHRINLMKMHDLFMAQSNYDPTMFAGLVFSIKLDELGYKQESDSKERKIKVLVFEEGKLVIMGVQCEEEMMASYRYMKKQLSVCEDKQKKEPTCLLFEGRISKKAENRDDSNIVQEDYRLWMDKISLSETLTEKKRIEGMKLLLDLTEELEELGFQQKPPNSPWNYPKTSKNEHQQQQQQQQFSCCCSPPESKKSRNDYKLLDMPIIC